jgi:hypothetical protein
VAVAAAVTRPVASPSRKRTTSRGTRERRSRMGAARVEMVRSAEGRRIHGGRVVVGVPVRVVEHVGGEVVPGVCNADSTKI